MLKHRIHIVLTVLFGLLLFTSSAWSDDLGSVVDRFAGNLSTLTANENLHSLAVAKISVNGESNGALASNLKSSIFSKLLSQTDIPIFDRTESHFRIEESKLFMFSEGERLIENRKGTHYAIISCLYNPAFSKAFLTIRVVEAETSKLAWFIAEPISIPESFVKIEGLLNRDLGNEPIPELDASSKENTKLFTKTLENRSKSTTVGRDTAEGHRRSLQDEVAYNLILQQIFDSANTLSIYDRESLFQLLDENSIAGPNSIPNLIKPESLTLISFSSSDQSSLIVCELTAKSIKTGALESITSVEIFRSPRSASTASGASSFTEMSSDYEKSARPRNDENLIAELVIDFRNLDLGTERMKKLLNGYSYIWLRYVRLESRYQTSSLGKPIIERSFYHKSKSRVKFINPKKVDSVISNFTREFIAYSDRNVNLIKAQIISLAFVGFRSENGEYFPGLLVNLYDSVRSYYTLLPNRNRSDGYWKEILVNEFSNHWLKSLNKAIDYSEIYEGKFIFENPVNRQEASIKYSIDFEFNGTKLVWVKGVFDFSDLRNSIYKVE